MLSIRIAGGGIKFIISKFYIGECFDWYINFGKIGEQMALDNRDRTYPASVTLGHKFGEK